MEKLKYKRPPLKPATTNIGRAIRLIRIMLDKSAKEVCKSQGMSRAHYCLVENGKAEPSSEYIEKCANGLGVSKHVILEYADKILIVKNPRKLIIYLGSILKENN
jgi:transcriptional regulator with XRE-family HTH domain